MLKSVLNNGGLGINAKKSLYEGVIVPTALCRLHFCYSVYSLFMIRNFYIFLDKCWVVNEIIEPAIFIFKTN